LTLLKFGLITLLGYLIGSIPWGLIIGHLVAKVDIRKYGSGRTGGTNVMRTLGRRAFLAVALLDIGKGAASVLIAGVILNGAVYSIGSLSLGTAFIQALAGMAAIIGHIWPIFANFRGGRGVATFFGALLVMCPVAGLFGAAILLLVALLSGYASLGSITGTVCASIITILFTLLWGYPIEYLFFSITGTLLITLIHQSNIKRLLAGNERPFNKRVILDKDKPE
jgi:glycerol-3-phosphate acyltransferase PlsY